MKLLDFKLLLFPLSFAIVAFGAPSLNLELSMAAAAVGYALFWRLAQGQFWLGTLWFAGVQAIQLDWLASTHYMGPLIIMVYVFAALVLGLQFGLLTWFVRAPLTWWKILALSGFWVLMEWSRLFFFSGFTWNPLGLSLAAHDYSIQFSSLLGVYGLCFWVVLTNLTALKDRRIWVVLALFPYLFGFCNQHYWSSRAAEEKPLSVALVQTALRPEQRDLVRGREKHHISPLIQWERILSYFQKEGKDRYDLIVFPESALPGGIRHRLYSEHVAKKIWSKFGTSLDFPPVESTEGQDSFITNAFWLHSLANHFGSEVIIGLDDGVKGAMYNAAFHFSAGSSQLTRNEKRVLVPIGEYVPFWFLTQFVSQQFGIDDSFCFGTQTKVFAGKIPMGLSICLEEAYGELVREARQKGARLLVNITNDVWFPETRLTWHHFDHGRLRAAENGAYSLRACNTGVTSIIDCFGKCQSMFPVSDTVGGILSAEVTAKSYPTLYTALGDAPILLLSFFLIVSYTARCMIDLYRVKKRQRDYRKEPIY